MPNIFILEKYINFNILTTNISYDIKDSGSKLPFSKYNKFLQYVRCIGFVLPKGYLPHVSKVINKYDVVQ